ncbi:acyltransferase [Algoriphagus kandeliae]|uniref:Acyltransferase n=1 Tax=Algoriphagus kandeliae TaxID=2562278 RepID=A0A4Y9R055_9BACT|nr:acyltransferase [Algoriphagus kandeliae]TFV97408.1 acyltransferase [Algoriphagus kandeliae]
MKVSPIRKNAKLRPWLWPIRLIGKFWKSPIPPGLWIVNKFFQSVLDINNDIPWMVHFTSRVTGNIEIGENVWKSFAISGGCYIQGINGVKIGDNTIFGPGVKIISANHSKGNIEFHENGKSIVIGKNCWIGANVTILPEVQLGDNVVVAANSVVTKSCSSNLIIGGIPAKILKENR